MAPSMVAVDGGGAQRSGSHSLFATHVARWSWSASPSAEAANVYDIPTAEPRRSTWPLRQPRPPQLPSPSQWPTPLQQPWAQQRPWLPHLPWPLQRPWPQQSPLPTAAGFAKLSGHRLGRRRFGIHQGWPWPLLPHRPQTLGAAAHPAEPSPGHASHHPPIRCRAVPLGPSPYRSLTAAVICEQHGGGDARIRAVRSVGTPLTAARPSGDAFLCRVIAGGRPKGSSA